jgi:hypothetical protein
MIPEWPAKPEVSETPTGEKSPIAHSPGVIEFLVGKIAAPIP